MDVPARARFSVAARLICGACLLCTLQPVRAQDDDELPRGWLASVNQGGVETSQIDADISFVWDEGAPRANWSGQLLIRNRTEHTFSAYVHGSIELRIDDQVVLAGTADAPSHLVGTPVLLEFGFRDVALTYEPVGDGGRLHFYWESTRFPIEPVSAHLLFREEDDAELDRIARGQMLFDAFRCARCHTGVSAPPPLAAPDLTYVMTGRNPEWLVEKLQHRHAGASHDKMPAFGFTEAEARAVAAYLRDAGKLADLPEIPAPKTDPKNPPPDGAALIHSLGCLACHVVGDLGESGPFGGGDLTTVGARRSPEALFSQLTQPEALNQHSRMPTFELTRVEQRQITLALSKLVGDGVAWTDKTVRDRTEPTLVAEGKTLFEAARCGACHTLGETETKAQAIPIGQVADDWETTCLAETPDRQTWRPAFPHADRASLKAFLSAGPPAATHQFARGGRVLERSNCLACHERGLGKGIVTTAGRVAAALPEFSGLSQALIPPNLTAIGEKLTDEALREAVAGRQKNRRLPWLDVRMPKFRHSEQETEDLVAHLIGHDRIPDGVLPAPPTIPADAATAVAGRQLVGATGFSCIACHEFGEYVPPNVAIATHGSNLLNLAGRMRPEYFRRWTRAPLRIVPGMEMPSYERPVAGVLDGDLDAQLEALWQALNDPEFKVPTNPAAVEQLLVVEPGAPPRVVRDVFTVSEAAGGGYTARALAVGFDNGHGVLFDLDAASVRDWAFGDFARQRTQGKSWFWDLAGTPLDAGSTAAPDIQLYHAAGGRLQSPMASDGGRFAQLRSYETRGRSVVFRYDLNFDTETLLDVEESWSPIESLPATHSGWQRNVAVRGDPGDWTPVITRRAVDPGELEMFVPVDGGAAPELTTTSTGDLAVPLKQDHEGVYRGVVPYVCRLTPNQARTTPQPEAPVEVAPVTSAPGFVGTRLPITSDIMPTALNWTSDGALVFTSLKGHVYRADDTDGDGIEETLTLVEEGLAAPFGILPDGDDLLVVHKPELLRLSDLNGDGRCDQRSVVADGWGFTHDYHDWTTGPVRAHDGTMYLGISSDYSQTGRPESAFRWRGKVLRLATDGTLTPFAHELRYPIGIALDASDRLFVTDQQGVQNTFNELNYLREGGRYGVPALGDPPAGQEQRANVQIPHPWTRSVNGLFFIPEMEQLTHPLAPFAGHAIGCEYNGRFLVRMSLQEVGGQLQGAAYEFTRSEWESDTDAFLGPICGGVAPDGSLYVGSIFDSGWLGGRNTGEIVRLTPSSEGRPNGIREIRAVPEGFEIEFLRAVDPQRAVDPGSYALSGYTRVWSGSYATDDSGRYEPRINSIEISEDARQVTLRITDLRARYVYDVACPDVGRGGAELHPDSGAYTMNVVPE